MNLVLKTIFGSHLYGLNTAESDTDYKAIYIPTAREIVLGTAKKNITTSTGPTAGKNQAGDIDMETVSLAEFVKLACQGQTMAIDMLHTTSKFTEFRDPAVWDFLVRNRKRFYCTNMSAFMGYVKKQAAKYSIKASRLASLETLIAVSELYSDAFSDEFSLLTIASKLPVDEFCYWEDGFYVVNKSKNQSCISVEELRSRVQKQYDNYGARAQQAKENKGIDWKAVSHALRAGYQLRDIFRDGDFEYPLAETEFILAVKTGQLDYTTQVAPVLEALVEEVDLLSQDSDLPAKVDTAFWDTFVYSIYKQEILNDNLC